MVLYQEVIALYEKWEAWEKWVDANNRMGYIYITQVKYKQGLAHLQQVLREVKNI